MIRTLKPNFESVSRPTADYIRKMFDGMSGRYDLFTRWTGFGQAQRWREICLDGLLPGMRVLDLACGTGDLALAASFKVGPEGKVVGLDFSGRMLEKARERYAQLRGSRAPFETVQKPAEELPIGDALFDRVVSGFALRNLYQNIDRILVGVYRSLKPGGEIAFLDVTEPEPFVLKSLWRVYFYGIAGLYGYVLFGKDYPIPYLPQSYRRFYKPAAFLDALRNAGFSEPRATGFFLGSVTLYQARKAS